jgi:CIC family chloride channel protein
MKNFSATMTRWLNRWQPSETWLLGGAALLVGLLSGLGIWLFKALIELARTAAFEGLGGWLAPLGHWSVAIIPASGGLIVGLIVWRFVGEERHHGVAGIIEAVALAGGRLRYWRIPAKTVAAAVSIGAGASVGPEDPSVQIGSNLGSALGQALRLSDDRVRSLVAAGAAGAVAAAFNAPIAGVFFALEIVLGEISGGALGLVVMSAVMAAVVTQALSGAQPAFRVPAYAFGSVWELPLYAVLGALAGPLAALYVRLVYLAQDWFHRLKQLPRWLKPALAGLLVGAVGVWRPEVFGEGYHTIESILGQSGPPLLVLLALLGAKLVLTPVSIGGGFPGGVFAPALFLGAALGGAFGLAADAGFPSLGIAPPAFAMVGMAAVLAGTVHAPLTAILLLFEMTNDYHIILPVMFAVVISQVFAQRLLPDSVYTLGLARKGIRLQRGRDVEVLEGLTVGEVMQPGLTVLGEGDTLTAALETLLRHRRHGLPVVDAAGQLAGVVTLQDIDRMPATEREGHTVGEVCTRDLLVAHPDETIGAALRRMGTRDIGQLPVVARSDTRHLLGELRRADLVRAYDAALAQRATRRHHVQQVRLGVLSGVTVEEVRVEGGAPCAEKKIRDVAWPREVVIASLRRGRAVLVPNGETILHAGDMLVVVAMDGELRNAVRQLCAVRPD